jgi:predicted amidohydrolase YtcJ
MDGVVEGSTAYIEEPYKHMPDSQGELLWDPQKYNEMCAALEKAGFQIQVHSIGDASTRITLDGFAYARQQNNLSDPRHGITHLQMVNAEDIKRFGELGVMAIPQPYWFVVDSYYTQAIEYLGQERADNQYPMKSFFDNGVNVASSSDYPVTIPPRPLDAIESGVTRAWPGETGPNTSMPPETERVSVEDMIASFTINGAYAYFLENETGSLETGKKADIVVLDKNILDLEPSEIHSAEVMLTYFGGQEVYRNEGFE